MKKKRVAWNKGLKGCYKQTDCEDCHKKYPAGYRLKNSEVVLVGYGYVGKETHKIFPTAEAYDIKWKDELTPTKKYKLAVICVSTPSKLNGGCDTSAVWDSIKKIKAELYLIKSTIPPGTSDKIQKKYPKKGIVFSPEYVASSSPYPAPLADMKQRDFIILGGRPENTKKVRRLYEKIYPPTVKIMEVPATCAEVIKYAENAFIATKVTFCNELYRICRAFSVDYDQAREGVFRLDPRMTEWWTYCEGKGWAGHCLPKDMKSIIKACEKAGYNPEFLKAVVENNERHKGET